ncbi:Nucleotidylyl transferase [Amanita rubescens]|nr:Nucleotidylyl transferase [Amanita rubescens]
MSIIATAVNRVQSRLSTVELVHASHPTWPFSTSLPKRPLRISVLDSSFNPPTLAHLALANSLRPNDADDYDARLLLLSVRNADKALGPGDATLVQRVEMMRLLTRHITNTPDNVAIAIINEPTFVGKSSQLLSFLRQRFSDPGGAECPRIQLSFILGFDTLERLVAPRYYGSAEQMLSALRKFLSPPPDGDDSFIVCARRHDTIPKTEAGHVNNDSDLSKLQYVQEFVNSGRIAMIDIGAVERTISSTAVRSAGDSSWESYVNDTIAQYIRQHGLYLKK